MVALTFSTKASDPYNIGVRMSRELERILTIPRRDLSAEHLNQIREVVTRPEAKMQLWDNQAACLLDALDAEGGFFGLGVGEGKTLVATLLPTVLEKRAVILTMPGLVKQGQKMMHEYKEDFIVRPDIRFLAYSTLSHKNHADALDRLQPEVIICDEAHKLSAKNTATFKRFARYKAENPSTILIFLTGTPVSKSILEIGHLLHYALGEYTPLPRDFQTLKEWSEAIDPTNNPRPEGKLRLLCEGVENIQQGLRRRMVDTRGIVISNGIEIETKLEIHTCEPPKLSPLEAVVETVEKLWERPDGEILTYAMEVAQAVRQVRLGGFYQWKWPNGEKDEDWLEARKEFNTEMREFLKHRAKAGLDSPALVEAALIRGEVRFDSWSRWATEKLKPVPPKEWVWITKDVVKRVAGMVKSIEAQDGAIIVWTDIVTFGTELGRELKVHYYGAGSKSAAAILNEKGDRTIVASIQAHGTGRNLQMFSRAFVAGGSTSNKTWEQLLGRLHRSGQKADTVRYDVLFREEIDGALRYARFSQDLTSHQRLLSAKIVHHTPSLVAQVVAKAAGSLRGIFRKTN